MINLDMTHLNMNNYNHESDESSRFVYMSRAIFAHDLILEGNAQSATKMFPDVFDFANDNKHLQPRLFNNAVSKLFTGL